MSMCKIKLLLCPCDELDVFIVFGNAIVFYTGNKQYNVSMMMSEIQ